MSSGSACWILWLTPMDWLALSIGRSGSQPLEYSHVICNEYKDMVFHITVYLLIFFQCDFLVQDLCPE